MENIVMYVQILVDFVMKLLSFFKKSDSVNTSDN